MMKNTQLSPFEFGAKACREGRPCIPILDEEFRKTLSKQVGQNTEALGGWVRGWTDERLNGWQSRIRD